MDAQPQRTVSPALTPPPGNPRFPALDGLRAFATFTVIWFHVGLDQDAFSGGRYSWLSNLTFGPPLFFLMSAFLLYRPFVQARTWGTPAPTTLGFWRKRALRIFPGYWVALTILALYPGLPGHVLSSHWWLYYGLLHTYSASTVYGGLAISWTICTEISFYLLLPAIVWGVLRFQRRAGLRAARDLELVLLAIVAVLSFLWFRHWQSQPLTPLNWAHTLWLPGEAAFFAAGMALARLSVNLPGTRPLRDFIPSWTAFWVACYGGAIAIYAWKVAASPGTQTRWLINGAIAVALALPCVFGRPDDRGITRLMALPVMTFLGTVSYGTYLYHRGFLHVLQHNGVDGTSYPGLIAMCLFVSVAAIGIGTVSYYVIERPCLRLKYGRRVRPAPAPIADQEPAPATATTA